MGVKICTWPSNSPSIRQVHLGLVLQVSDLIIPRNSSPVFSSWSPWAPRRHRVKLREVVAALWSTGFV